MSFNSLNYTRKKDIIIVSAPADYYEQCHVEDMYHSIKQVFPDNKILCIPDDISISIIREENPFL